MAVIGGGVMGCTTALHLARGRMDVVLLERSGLCMEASGRNTGTFTLMFPDPLLIPYTQRGMELWRTAANWLGHDVGYQQKGGLEVALTEDEAPVFETEMRRRKEAGAPIEIIGANRAREIEPALSKRPVLAAFCPDDAHAQSYLTGAAFRAALLAEDVDLRDGTAVLGVDRSNGAFVVRTAAGAIAARRLILAGGAWLGKIAGWFHLDLPLASRIHQGIVLERMRPLLRVIVRVFGMLSLKQGTNGTILMGTVLHWIGDPDHAATELDTEQLADKMVECLVAARSAVPALAEGRVVRTWTGIEGYAPDNLPVIGPLPGVDGVFVIGCMRSGYTIGPCVGKLLAAAVLGREPEMPIFTPSFDPTRLLTMTLGADSPAMRSGG